MWEKIIWRLLEGKEACGNATLFGGNENIPRDGLSALSQEKDQRLFRHLKQRKFASAGRVMRRKYGRRGISGWWQHSPPACLLRGKEPAQGQSWQIRSSETEELDNLSALSPRASEGKVRGSFSGSECWSKAALREGQAILSRGSVKVHFSAPLPTLLSRSAAWSERAASRFPALLCSLYAEIPLLPR